MTISKRDQIDEAAAELEKVAGDLQVMARVIKNARDSQDFQEGVQTAQKLLDRLRSI